MPANQTSPNTLTVLAWLRWVLQLFETSEFWLLLAGLVVTVGLVFRAGLVVMEHPLDPIQMGPGGGEHFWVDYRVDTALTTSGLFITECDDNSGNFHGALRSGLVLYEDDAPLGPPHSAEQAIRDTGHGAYSYQCVGAEHTLAFSTSDNSDPRVNGHHYRVRYPIRMLPELFWGGLALMAVLGMRRLLALRPRPRPRLANGLAGRLDGGAAALSAFELAIIIAAGLAFSATWAVVVGQDVNFDQRNYHIYAPFAWLADRAQMDIAPGQVQTWSNPFPHLPDYLAIAHLPPVVAGAVIGAFASFNFLLLYLIGWQLFPGEPRATRHALVAPAAVIGITSATFLSELGTTYVDNTACLPLLAAVWLALRMQRLDDRNRHLPLLAGGVGGLAGLAIGLKLTHLIFLPGLALGVLLCRPRPVTLWLVAPAGLVGLGLGFLAGCGPPAWEAWQHYANPFFPYFNDIFKSPFYKAEPFANITYIPQSIGEAFSLPVLWAFDYSVTNQVPHCLQAFHHDWFCVTTRTSEGPSQDPRFLLIEVTLLAVLGMALMGLLVRALKVRSFMPGGAGPGATGLSRRFLMVFFLTGLVLWTVVFAYQRYLIALELLGGPVLAVGVFWLLGRARVLGLTLAAVVAVALTRPTDWGRVPYGQSWYQLDIPAALSVPNTLFVLVNGRPTAHLVPFFPRSDRFVRLSGNIILTPDTGFGLQAERMLAGQQGPILVLAPAPAPFEVGERTFYDPDLKALARFRIETDFNRCMTLTSVGDRITACPAKRSEASLHR